MRTLDFLGQTYNLHTAGDALDMIGRLADAVTGIMSDLDTIGKDISYSKTRLDYQAGGLRWLGSRANNQALASGTFGGGGDGLVAVAALGLSGGLNGPAPNIPPIAPNQGGGGGGGTSTPSVHRNTALPPVAGGINPALLLLPMGGGCDRTHGWKLQSNGGVIGAGQILFTVTYGTQYQAPPVVTFSEGLGSISPATQNPTATGYELINNQAIQPGGGYFVYVVVTPTVENFD